MLFLLLLLSLSFGLERKFDKETYNFLDVFGTMLTGNHLPVSDDRYGGTKCAGCTIVLILVESLSDVHGTSIEYEVEKLCSRLPVILQKPCDDFVSVWAPVIIPLLEKKETADAVCLAINFCGGGDPGPVCRLLNAPNDLEREARVIAETRQMIATRKQTALTKKTQPQSKRDTPWGWLVHRLEVGREKKI